MPLPGASGAVTAVAAATAAGTIEILAVQQGPLLPLHLSASASLAAHSGSVQVGRARLSGNVPGVSVHIGRG